MLVLAAEHGDADSAMLDRGAEVSGEHDLAAAHEIVETEVHVWDHFLVELIYKDMPFGGESKPIRIFGLVEETALLDDVVLHPNSVLKFEE